MINLIHLQQQADRRASRYGRHDAVIREVAHRIAERLDLIRCQPELILEAGCGPGRDLAELQQRYPQAQVLALDLSEKNLRQFHTRTSPMKRWLQAVTGTIPAAPWPVQADLAHLPVKKSSIDFLYSNLALQYQPQPHRVLPEWARVLKPGGLLMFSSLGPDSFAELRDAGLSKALLPLVDMHDLGDMLVDSGFTTPVMDMEKLVLTYKSAQDLLNELHALGGNPLMSRGRGLHTPRQLARWCQRLEQTLQVDGRIHLTLEIIYGHAWRASPAQHQYQGADGSTWVGVPLTQLTQKRKRG